MATVQSGGGGSLTDVVSSAREFVIEKLRDADSPMSPKELSREYGCGLAHMHNVCSELAQEGEIERVEEGQYVEGDGDSTESGDSEPEQADEQSGSEPELSPRVSTDSEPGPPAEAAAAAPAMAAPVLLDEADPKVLLVAVVLIVVLGYLLLKDGDGSTDETETEPEPEGPSSGGDLSEGGLLG